METKQKVILVITILLLGICGYLAYGILFPNTGSNSAPPPKTTQTAVKTPPAQTGSAIQQHQQASQSTSQSSSGQQAGHQFMNHNQANSQGIVAGQTTGATQGQQTTQPSNQVTQVPKSKPTPEQLALLQESQQAQAEYVKLINEYQLAQLQQRLAQTNASIATSKLAEAKTLVQTQAIKAKMSGHPLATSASTSATSKTTKGLEVSYVGKAQGAWQAVLVAGSSYYQVKVGTHLPDGSVVSKINSMGVTLLQDGQQHFLAMPATID